jgi:hypothetical protein
LRVYHYKLLDNFFATSQAVLESSTKEDSELTGDDGGFRWWVFIFLMVVEGRFLDLRLDRAKGKVE